MVTRGQFLGPDPKFDISQVKKMLFYQASGNFLKKIWSKMKFCDMVSYCHLYGSLKLEYLHPSFKPVK